MSVFVLGSANIDVVARAPRLPRAGETIAGSAAALFPGGKGANQAVAASRAGARVRFLGRIGDDPFGVTLAASLRDAGVDVAALAVETGVSTGLAAIVVAGGGENQIVVVPGANACVGAREIDALRAGLAREDVVLLQLEVPLDTVVAAAEAARASGARVVLDPAPAPVRGALPDALYAACDVLTPNESEAATLLGGAEVCGVDDGFAAARALAARGPRAVIVTLGAAGAAVFAEGRAWHQPPFPCACVDATAAGDAFNGALAAALAAGADLTTAVRHGAAAGALAASQSGAQSSLPGRAAIDRVLATGTVPGSEVR